MNKEIVVKEDQLPTELLDEITASAGVGTAFDVPRCRYHLYE